MQRWLLALSIALATMPARDALADSPTVAVLSVEMAGDAEPELRPRVAESIARGLGGADRNVVPLDRVMDELSSSPELLGCTSTACLERIADRVGARQFVRAQLRTDGVTYTLGLQLLSAAEDEPLIRDLEADCTVCRMAELFEWVSATSSELILPERTASAAVTIETDPSGATVEVGGRAIGRSPADAKLPVGEHDISADLDGHTAAGTTLRVEEGDPGPYQVELTLVPDDEALSSRRFGTWKWVTAGGAVAGVATGVALLALDGRQNCELSAGQEQCPQVVDGRTPGFVSVGLGAILGTASGWMFYRDASRDRSGAITAGPGAGGSLRVTF